MANVFFSGYEEGVLANFQLTDEDIEYIATHDIMVSAIWGNIHHQLSKIQAQGIQIAFDFATKLGDDVFETAEVRNSLRSICKSGASNLLYVR